MSFSRPAPSLSISIHVPRVGDDGERLTCEVSSSNFNPRPPCGGRPIMLCIVEMQVVISIHVPRVGDDPLVPSIIWICSNFNPRPPRGGRRRLKWTVEVWEHFNPRPPRGGRQRKAESLRKYLDISIHVPRVGDDLIMAILTRRARKFQSTSPAWGTTSAKCRYRQGYQDFNPRPPRGGRLA